MIYGQKKERTLERYLSFHPLYNIGIKLIWLVAKRSFLQKQGLMILEFKMQGKVQASN